jgi:sugar phosphate isomerase/epimerase
MFKAAFSTVACPHWTLARVAAAAAEHGYAGVELRTFGSGSTQFACDPALTSAEKTRTLFGEAGVTIASLATGVAFDEPVRPPVIGRAFGDYERSVREAKYAIELAASIECSLVRVFGFEFPDRESRKSAMARICDRLRLAVDAARHTGVKLVIENGGSFCHAHDLKEIIQEVDSNLLGASYSMAVAADAGEDPAEGARLLADLLWVAKLKDRDADRHPCPPGDPHGTMPCREFLGTLGDMNFGGWVIFEWDRAWLPGLDVPEVVLPQVARRLFEWSGAESLIGGRAATARA